MAKKNKTSWPLWIVIIVILVAVIVVARTGIIRGRPASATSSSKTVQSPPSATSSKTTVVQPIQETRSSTQTRQPTWQTIKTWEGTGAKNTETFTVGKEWRVVWAAKDTTGFGGSIFQVYVMEPGSDLLVALPANVVGSGKDTSYVYEDGKFYLMVNTANCSWSVTVQDLR